MNTIKYERQNAVKRLDNKTLRFLWICTLSSSGSSRLSHDQSQPTSASHTCNGIIEHFSFTFIHLIAFSRQAREQALNGPERVRSRSIVVNGIRAAFCITFSIRLWPELNCFCLCTIFCSLLIRCSSRHYRRKCRNVTGAERKTIKKTQETKLFFLTFTFVVCFCSISVSQGFFRLALV